jgi:pimeloyl-ACP methyl ester carboxylesterase
VATFALVPGAWHGAWCWERVSPVLAEAGHRVVAVDLPCEDTSAGCAAYRDITVDAIGDDSDDLVVVGHSAGGLTAPLVAAARPTRRLVFISALLPDPGRSLTEQNEAEGIFEHEYQAGIEEDANGCRRWFDEEICGRTMYSGCSPRDVSWAFGHLRPQASTMYTELTPLEEWPDVPVTDIRGDDDRLVSPRWAAKTVPERLGVTSIVISGAGHSSMLSHADQLALSLLDTAR